VFLGVGSGEGAVPPPEKIFGLFNVKMAYFGVYLRYLFESTGLQHKAVKVAVTAYYGEAPVGLLELRVVTGPLFVLPVFFFSLLGKVAGRAIYFTVRNFFLIFLMISRRQII